MAKNYTLGRGKLYFSRFIGADPTKLEGYRHVGNTPEFNLTIEQEVLEHFNSDSGIREVDESVPLEVTRSGSMTMDDIQSENVALFFFGTSATITQSSSPGLTDNTLAVKKGKTYHIGRTAAKPDGERGIGNVLVKDATDVTTYVAGTDYTVDLDRGLITILATGAIADDDVIHITFDRLAKSWPQVISGSQPVEGAILFVQDNPVGENHDYVLPHCKISPNGDFALKGDDWQQIPFSIEILKPTSSEAILRDGQPV